MQHTHAQPCNQLGAAACPNRVLFAAQGGSWSPATHHHWPAAFKAAACTLLLAGSRSGSSAGGGTAAGGDSSTHHSRQAARWRRREAAAAAAGVGLQAGCPLDAMPAELLLQVIAAAAQPLSAWL